MTASPSSSSSGSDGMSCISGFTLLKKDELRVMECPSLVAVTIEPFTFETVCGLLLYGDVSWNEGAWFGVTACI